MFLVLFVIPCVAALLALLLRQASGPFWLCTNIDPSYGYLINGLYLVQGIVPGHTDHPGTPLQWLIFLVDHLCNWGCSSADIVRQVLISPEFYLHLVYGVLVLLMGLTAFLLGRYAYHRTRDIVGALVLQLPALWFVWFMPVAAKVSPEPLLVSVLNVYSICLLWAFFDPLAMRSWKLALCFGLLAGTLMAVKVNVLPLLLIPLVLLQGRGRVIFCAVAAAGFLLWTVPIWPRYEAMFSWFVKLATHTGIHGKGAAQLLDRHDYLWQCKDIVKTYFWLMIVFVPVFLVGSFAWLRNRQQKELLFLVAVGAAILAQWALAAKYPARYYLVPGFAMCGLFFFFAYCRWFAAVRLRKFFILAVVIVSGAVSIMGSLALRRDLRRDTREIIAFNEQVHRKYAGCLFVNYFRSSGLEAALHIGDLCFEEPGVGPQLAGLYPGGFFFDRYRQVLERFKEPVLAEDLLARYGCVIFQGEPEVDFSDTAYEVRLLERGRFEVYRQLTGILKK